MPEPWVRFEDADLLVVAKPAGVTTHRAHVHAQDGMHEWVQARRPGTSLSILHRLDKATSGLLAFGKTPEANRALTAQLEARAVDKRYDLLAERDDRRPPTLRCDDPIGDEGGRDGRRGPRAASTDFERAEVGPDLARWEAHPRTGRTHQVRLHAQALGLPILGDDEHGGADAARLFLHARSLRFEHPDGRTVELEAPRPPSFDRALSGEASQRAPLAALVAHEARAALLDPEDTDAYLWIDRHHDGFAGLRLERLGDVALALTYGDDDAPPSTPWLDAWQEVVDLRAVYHQHRPRGGGGEVPRLVRGDAAPGFSVTELGCRYLVDLSASATSTGLFLDQRETRHRLLHRDLTGRTVLNAFGHTGSLSVAAARAGAETLTLDLSKRYLEWANENLRANGIDPADHDAIYGDALDWMRRLEKKGRTFDVVLVDPPSASTSAKGGRWTVERDLHQVVERGARLCAPGGTLFVSTNLHRMRWQRFLDHVADGLAAAGREGAVEPQTLPLDHRSGSGDPPYLKAAWIVLDGAER